MTILIRGDMHCVWNESDDLGIQVLQQAEHISRVIIPLRGRLWYAAHPLRAMFYEIRDRVVRATEIATQCQNLEGNAFLETETCRNWSVMFDDQLKTDENGRNFLTKVPQLHGYIRVELKFKDANCTHPRPTVPKNMKCAAHILFNFENFSNRNLISAQIHH